MATIIPSSPEGRRPADTPADALAPVNQNAGWVRSYDEHHVRRGVARADLPNPARAQEAHPIALEREKAQLCDDGFCVIPGVLEPSEAAEVRHRLVAAAAESERRGVPTFIPGLDPNEHNVRVFNLLDLDPVFVDLIQHPIAIELATHLLADGFLISNFTANIARPGSKSMVFHSDQSLVVAEPWHSAQALNVIWCLDDVHEANGATRYLPGSHRFTCQADVPADALGRTRPFEAKAGSVVGMGGRLWHTSGANVTRDEERALMFGFYSADFIRPQANWNASLSATTIARLSPPMHEWLGLGAQGNARQAARMLRL